MSVGAEDQMSHGSGRWSAFRSKSFLSVVFFGISLVSVVLAGVLLWSFKPASIDVESWRLDSSRSSAARPLKDHPLHSRASSKVLNAPDMSCTVLTPGVDTARTPLSRVFERVKARVIKNKRVSIAVGIFVVLVIIGGSVAAGLLLRPHDPSPSAEVNDMTTNSNNPPGASDTPPPQAYWAVIGIVAFFAFFFLWIVAFIVYRRYVDSHPGKQPNTLTGLVVK